MDPRGDCEFKMPGEVFRREGKTKALKQVNDKENVAKLGTRKKAKGDTVISQDDEELRKIMTDFNKSVSRCKSGGLDPSTSSKKKRPSGQRNKDLTKGDDERSRKLAAGRKLPKKHLKADQSEIDCNLDEILTGLMEDIEPSISKKKYSSGKGLKKGALDDSSEHDFETGCNLDEVLADLMKDVETSTSLKKKNKNGKGNKSHKKGILDKSKHDFEMGCNLDATLADLVKDLPVDSLDGDHSSLSKKQKPESKKKSFVGSSASHVPTAMAAPTCFLNQTLEVSEDDPNFDELLSQLLEGLNVTDKPVKLQSLSGSVVSGKPSRRKKEKSGKGKRSKKGSTSSNQSQSSTGTCLSERSLDHILDCLGDETENHVIHCGMKGEAVQEKEGVLNMHEKIDHSHYESQGLFTQEEEMCSNALSGTSDAKNFCLGPTSFTSIESKCLDVKNSERNDMPAPSETQPPSLSLFSSLDTEQSLPVCPDQNASRKVLSVAVQSKTIMNSESKEHADNKESREITVPEENLESMPLFSSLDSEQSLGVLSSKVGNGQSEKMTCFDKYSQVIPNMDIRCIVPECNRRESLPLFSSLDSEKSLPVGQQLSGEVRAASVFFSSPMLTCHSNADSSLDTNLSVVHEETVAVGETDDEDLVESSDREDELVDASCDRDVVPESDISSASECIASSRNDDSCDDVVSSDFNQSRASRSSFGSRIGSFREFLTSPQQRGLPDSDKLNTPASLYDNSPIAESGSYTELLKNGKRQKTPNGRQTKKGLSTSTPNTDMKRDNLPDISVRNPAVFTEIVASPALAKHSPLCKEVISRDVDQSPHSTPCDIKQTKLNSESGLGFRNSPMSKGSPVHLGNSTGSPLVSRNIVKSTTPSMLMRDTPNRSEACIVMTSPKSTESLRDIQNALKATGSPMLTRDTPNRSGSCFVTSPNSSQSMRDIRKTLKGIASPVTEIRTTDTAVSPIVTRPIPSTESSRVTKGTPKTKQSSKVLNTAKPIRSPLITGVGAKNVESPNVRKNTPRQMESPRLTRSAQKMMGSPLVAMDSPIIAGARNTLSTSTSESPKVQKNTLRIKGSPRVPRNSPETSGSPTVPRKSRNTPISKGSPQTTTTRNTPKSSGSPMVLRNTPKCKGSPLVDRNTPKSALCPIQLRFSAGKVAHDEEDGVYSSSEQRRLFAEKDSVEHNEICSDDDKSVNSSVEVAEKSLQVSFISQEDTEDSQMTCSQKFNDSSVINVCDEICQVSFASLGTENYQEPSTETCSQKLNDSSIVNVCDEMCQVSLSSCGGSQEDSEDLANSDTDSQLTDSNSEESLSYESRSETSCSEVLEGSDTPYPPINDNNNLSQPKGVDNTDKSFQVSFSSPGEDMPSSHVTCDSPSQDSNQLPESVGLNSDDDFSNSEQSRNDGNQVTQINKILNETKSLDQQSLSETCDTVYDTASSSLKNSKSSQNWRSQTQPSSDEDDVPKVKPRRQASRSSKKQANVALAKVFDSSSSEDLDDFFNKMKSPAKKQSESESDLSDFIVSDGESFETADESPEIEDDEVFYINTGRLIEEQESNKKPPKIGTSVKPAENKKKTLHNASGKKSLYNNVLNPIFYEEPSDEDVKMRRKKRAARFASPNNVLDIKIDKESGDVNEFKTPCPLPRRGTKSTGKTKANKYVELSSDSEEGLEDFKTCPRPGKETSRKTPKNKYVEFSSDSEDDFKTCPPPVKSDSLPDLPRKTTSQTPVFRLPTLSRVPKTISSIRHGTVDKTTTSFLKSLNAGVESDRRHPEAHKFVTNFKSTREVLTKKLFDLFCETVFENKLPEFPVIWNSRLTKTAGYCAYSREKPSMVLKCRIELSVKVCDSAERLRDTLIHEMCHAAVWLLNGKKDGHGPIWKSWAQKANTVHCELPIIRRCHSYSIETKFIYKCSKCGYQLGRHSKSLDIVKKVCGYCRGHFELYSNGKNGLKKVEESTTKTPNKFAMFVKENYGSIKSSNKKSQHKDVMKILSEEFAKTKISFS